jgi:hypothetical protein
MAKTFFELFLGEHPPADEFRAVLCGALRGALNSREHALDNGAPLIGGDHVTRNESVDKLIDKGEA